MSSGFKFSILIKDSSDGAAFLDLTERVFLEGLSSTALSSSGRALLVEAGLAADFLGVGVEGALAVEP